MIINNKIERSCSPELDEPNLAFNLEVVDWVNQKKGNTAREAAMMIVHKVNDRSPPVPMLALSLLDVCVKNCGYPFHLQVATKEFLNKLVRRFPERPPYRLSRVQTRILQIIAEWNQTLCLTNRYKEDLMNIRYVFPSVQYESTSVLNTPDNFRSIEELEKEDRETQSAKLQELVRRGTPADLVEANRLMKILAGYDTGMRNNYRAKIAEDIEKIRRKTLLLQEMLKKNNSNALYQSDIYQDLISSVKDAQPKIQRILEQEKGDSDAISKLLELNDIINFTISQYEKNSRKEILDNTKNIKTTSKESTMQNDISLIDLEDEPTLQKYPDHLKNEESDLNDLLGLSFDNFSINSFHKTDEKIHLDSKPLLLMDENLPNSQNSKSSSIQNLQTHKSLNNSLINTQNVIFHNDMISKSASNYIPQIQTSERKNTLNISVLDSPDLVIHFFMSRKSSVSNSPIIIRVEFSNKSFTDIISSLNFQIAAPKTILLKMEPQNGTIINPSQRNGIIQFITVFGVKNGSDDLKLKWKVSYHLGNTPIERSEFSNLSNNSKKNKQSIQKNIQGVQDTSKILKNNENDNSYCIKPFDSKNIASKPFNYEQKNKKINSFPKNFVDTGNNLSKLKIIDINNKETSIKKKINSKKSNTTYLKSTTHVSNAKRTILIPQAITVSNLSQLLGLKFNKLSRKMIDLGFKNLDYDFLLTFEEASLIAMEYDYNPVISNKESFDLFRVSQKDKQKTNSCLRTPIVTIMGHIDHGKTTLLDFLRKSSVALHEEGGITQHIGAFSVTVSNGEKICFLDTPGHSAFESMRKRGALITDIVVLVVAADDGVMPQTIEAIEHAKKAGVPIIVAINKIDKEGINIQGLKLDLLNNGVELEEFGGDTQAVLISAITGQGIKDLECAILTLAEILDIRSETKGNVEGWIIESSIKKTKGPLATVLVKEGTLKLGSYIVSGTTWCRVKFMTDTLNQLVDFALPGTAVEVAGWKDPPSVGEDVLEALNENQAKKVVKNRLLRLEREKQLNDIEVINKKRIENHLKESKTIESDLTQKESKIISFIVKGDVNGSVEAIKDALLLIGNDEIKTKVIFGDVGNVTESDVIRADAAKGYIISFNLKLNKKIAQFAYRKKVKIISHTEELSQFLSLKIKYNIIGEAKIIKIFTIIDKKTCKTLIAGCTVINGVINKNENIRVLRDQKIIWEGKLKSLRHIKKEMNEIKEGNECGMNFDKWNDFLEGDIVQTYTKEYLKQKL
ncbi:hypothetical protein PCK1_002524 [Pneumocystis canis]|nr:hypothetical protein PCK1_002524 [Pneumocystis canis]